MAIYFPLRRRCPTFSRSGARAWPSDLEEKQEEVGKDLSDLSDLSDLTSSPPEPVDLFSKLSGWQ